MRERLTRIVFAACCGATLTAALPNGASADVHDFVRWKPNGQLDYRLLLRRYMPVSSFRFGRRYYGYPYSGCGGLLQPYYYFVPNYYGGGGNPCAFSAPLLNHY